MVVGRWRGIRMWGKTTLFHALTGLRRRWRPSGVTVEKKVGRCVLVEKQEASSKKQEGGECQIIDLPGTYSLAVAGR